MKMCRIQADLTAYLLDFACCVYPKITQMSQFTEQNKLYL